MADSERPLFVDSNGARVHFREIRGGLRWQAVMEVGGNLISTGKGGIILDPSQLSWVLSREGFKRIPETE